MYDILKAALNSLKTNENLEPVVQSIASLTSFRCQPIMYMPTTEANSYFLLEIINILQCKRFSHFSNK